MPKDASIACLSASGRIDFELEMAFVVGKETEMGQSISTEAAEDHIFGMVLFNDWSARDIQEVGVRAFGAVLGQEFCFLLSPLG